MLTFANTTIQVQFTAEGFTANSTAKVHAKTHSNGFDMYEGTVLDSKNVLCIVTLVTNHNGINKLRINRGFNLVAINKFTVK